MIIVPWAIDRYNYCTWRDPVVVWLLECVRMPEFYYFSLAHNVPVVFSGF